MSDQGKGHGRRRRQCTRAREMLGWSRTMGGRCFDCRAVVTDYDTAVYHGHGDWTCDACSAARDLED